MIAVVLPEPFGPRSPKIQIKMVQSDQIAISFYKIFYMNHKKSSEFIYFEVIRIL